VRHRPRSARYRARRCPATCRSTTAFASASWCTAGAARSAAGRFEVAVTGSRSTARTIVRSAPRPMVAASPTCRRSTWSHTSRAGGSSSCSKTGRRARLEFFLCYPMWREMPAALQASIIGVEGADEERVTCQLFMSEKMPVAEGFPSIYRSYVKFLSSQPCRVLSSPPAVKRCASALASSAPSSCLGNKCP
jgi:hypothetical protein